MESAQPNALSSVRSHGVREVLLHFAQTNASYTNQHSGSRMPRLIPRLLKAIARGEHERGGYSGPLVTLKRPRVPSLWRPTKSTYNFRPGQQSLLLEPENPIIERRLYERHKKLPPYLRPKGRRNVVETEVDTPREMNEQERTWWASPYCKCQS